MDIERARELVELGNLEQYLQQMEIPCELSEGTAEFPVSTLLVELPEDKQGRKNWITLNYVPQEEGDFDHLRLLQFYSHLPFQYDPAYEGEVVKLLPKANGKLILGHFNLSHEQKAIAYRYTFTQLVKESLDVDAVMEIIMLLAFLMEMMAPFIENVATGRQNFETALAHLNAV